VTPAEEKFVATTLPVKSPGGVTDPGYSERVFFLRAENFIYLFRSDFVSRP